MCFHSPVGQVLCCLVSGYHVRVAIGYRDWIVQQISRRSESSYATLVDSKEARPLTADVECFTIDFVFVFSDNIVVFCFLCSRYLEV
jgi:hypothetical protein